jgi:hypothetical protein
MLKLDKRMRIVKDLVVKCAVAAVLQEIRTALSKARRIESLKSLSVAFQTFKRKT